MKGKISEEQFKLVSPIKELNKNRQKRGLK